MRGTTIWGVAARLSAISLMLFVFSACDGGDSGGNSSCDSFESNSSNDAGHSVAYGDSITNDTYIADVEPVPDDTYIADVEPVPDDTYISDVEPVPDDTYISDAELMPDDTYISDAEPMPGDTYAFDTVEDVQDNDFWFAIIDSLEQRWGIHWDRTYDTQDVFDAINDFGVDFVISTGDNTACNPTHPSEAVRCYLELVGAMKHYFDVPVYFIGGNHDLGSTLLTYYNPPIEYAHVVWEEYVAPLDQEFWHKGTHFILVSDGDAQMTPFWEQYPERYQWYCEHIDEHTLSFRHIVKDGLFTPASLLARYECEIGVVPYVFYGHFGQWEDLEFRGTRYVQTADAKNGNVRFVHVIDGEVTEMIEHGLE